MSRRGLFLRVLLPLLLLPAMAALATPAFYSASAWSRYGRGSLAVTGQSLLITDCWLASKQVLTDGQATFEARAPEGAEQVQIWAGFRCKDREHRYVVALRGGNNNDLYLARYAPDGEHEFLGQALLENPPKPGEWHTLRVVTLDKRILVFLDNEALPRLNVVDKTASWTEGGVVLGGGWLPAEFRACTIQPLEPAAKAAMVALGDSVWQPRPVEREALRVRQRAEYRPFKVPTLSGPRTELSIDGKWLFKPDQELGAAAQPSAPGCDDQSWHLLEVPGLWTPQWAWLHGESGGWKFDGGRADATKGVSDRYRALELARVNGYTFDWQKTESAWYRHYLDLPRETSAKHLELCFDAIAKICEIFVNGQKVGAHVGMFGMVRCDITGAVKPGRNVLAVHVLRNYARHERGTKVEAVAVSVPVTSEMLRSLPHGMYNSDPGGIWQPVKLVITDRVRIDDVFIQPRLDGATIDVSVAGSDAAPQKVEIGYSIRDWRDHSLLYQSTQTQAVALAGQGRATVRLETPVLHPRLWSPESPNLYTLELELRADGRLADRQATRFGFRTFAVEKNRLLLNGQPYWLRGGNHFPHPLRPNDRELALRFMQLAHEGNVRVTRSHVGPMSSVWLDAADEVGIGVSYEGNWPWLMLKGEVPDETLLRVWREEMSDLIRTHRNHPSLLMWTVNNEMKFYLEDRADKARLKRKWQVLSDMVQQMRRLDPARPIVADSAYVRRETGADYESVVKPNHFDDGDIDDSHRYFGWYNESFMHLMNGRFGKSLAWPDRPLISQELSTGYPRNDDGHPTRFYLFKHCTPQALVGLDAYEDRDPAIFLERQAFMTKELLEAIRRSNHQELAGVCAFAYLTWFKDVYDVKRIEPFPTYYAVKTAFQPVLVSAELFGRHFYAGETIRRRVCIVNDAENGQALPATRLRWQVLAGNQVLAEGVQPVPPVGYYQNQWQELALALPSRLPAPRVDARLVLTLEGATGTLSENNYDVLVATRSWASEWTSAHSAQVVVFDPAGELPDVRAARVKSLVDLAGVQARVLIVASLEQASKPELDAVKQFAARGGQVLSLHAGRSLPQMLPEQVRGYQARAGEIVTMHAPESPVFADLAWRDLAWFEPGAGKLPQACQGVYQVCPGRSDVKLLADQCDLHAYLQKPADFLKYSGSPLVEIRLGQGRILASEMDLSARVRDAVPGRLLSNMIHYLLAADGFSAYEPQTGPCSTSIMALSAAAPAR